MSNAPHLELITELLPVTRRDFALAAPAILNPYDASPLFDGEWLILNGSYQLVRDTGETVVPSFQVFAERGRYDTQAIGKVPVLFLGGYEFETDVMNATHGFSLGYKAVVDVVDMGDGVDRCGLAVPAGATQHLVVAWATRIISSTRVRFWKPAGPTFWTGT